ncbi:unnamed protein product, partial [Rotaria magnacalcarata]
MSAVLIFQNSKGRDLLMMNGYSYTLNKEVEVQYYWRCETRLCSATLITTRNISTDGHSISTEGEIHHLHAPSIAKQEIRVFRAQAKRRVREELTPAALFIEQEMRKINLFSEAQQLLTHPQHMKAAFSRERHKYIPNIPQSLDFIISHMYTLTRGFKRFRLNDKTTLPATKHKGCFFHFNQSLHRRLASEGLAIAYRDEEKVRKWSKYTMALALLPPNETENALQLIKLGAPKRMKKFVQYVQDFWFNKIGVNMWNVNDLKFRTNNACECIKSSLMDGTSIPTHNCPYLVWHARFARRVITKHPQGLANICAQSSQYHGKEYPCANIDMQDRLISLVNAGIPDGKSELELKNNGFKSGLVYKLIQKEQQQLLNV